MEIKKINFEDDSAQRIYHNYLETIQNILAPINIYDKEEVIKEINSHIYEGMRDNQPINKVEYILNVIERLGDPNDYLKPYLAENLLKRSTRTFNPLHIFRALLLNIQNGTSYIIISIMYSLLMGFVFLIVAKIIHPRNVGLFLKDGRFQTFGLTDNTFNSTEMLGNWFIPTTLLAMTLFYIAITLLLKLISYTSKKTDKLFVNTLKK